MKEKITDDIHYSTWDEIKRRSSLIDDHSMKEFSLYYKNLEDASNITHIENNLIDAIRYSKIFTGSGTLERAISDARTKTDMPASSIAYHIWSSMYYGRYSKLRPENPGDSIVSLAIRKALLEMMDTPQYKVVSDKAEFSPTRSTLISEDMILPLCKSVKEILAEDGDKNGKSKISSDARKSALGDALDDASENAEKAESDMESIGIGSAPGDWSKTDPTPYIDAAKMINGRVKKIIGHIGKMVSDYNDINAGMIRTNCGFSEFDFGSELSQIPYNELAKLGMDGVDDALLIDLINAEAPQVYSKVPLSRGHIVVCVDKSGSMSGSNDVLARAIALSVAKIARKTNRKVSTILFDCTSEMFDMGNPKDVVRMASIGADGGTDFQSPLEYAFSSIEKSNYKTGRARADILFITDGCAQISDMKKIVDLKKKTMSKIFTIIIGKDSDGSSMECISDSMADVSSIEDIHDDCDTMDEFWRSVATAA